ncbi:serine/threonine-protein kinase par-1-like [Littorina saxatilis]|uniref:Protein kinase domain-containing protein n=1 Tax=Littorina saxatilis TaxID=31220 RepID=A0AAN9BB93_9CAEN
MPSTEAQSIMGAKRHQKLPDNTAKGHIFPDNTKQATDPPTLHDNTPGTLTLHDTTPGTPTLHDTTPGTPTLHDTTPGTPTLHDNTPGTPTLHDNTPGTLTLQDNTQGTLTLYDNTPGTLTLHDNTPGTLTLHDNTPGTPTLHDNTPGTATLIQPQRHNLKNRFELLRTLGEGSYGKVKLACERVTGHQVAIKYVKKSKIQNEADLTRIRREIRILSSLRHPNIVNIRQVYEKKDRIVLVMDCATGGELYDYLNTHRCLPESQTRRFFRQISAALHCIHQNGIVHRDLKLENIVLDEERNVKIADFGLANYFSPDSMLKTFCGSPLYASPEIVNGKAYHGPEVDVWSLGVILYTLSYGAMPFQHSNLKVLRQQISSGHYVQPSQPCGAASLIRHMLTVKSSLRATLPDILGHWWVNLGHDVTPDGRQCRPLTQSGHNTTFENDLDPTSSLPPPGLHRVPGSRSLGRPVKVTNDDLDPISRLPPPGLHRVPGSRSWRRSVKVTHDESQQLFDFGSSSLSSLSSRCPQKGHERQSNSDGGLPWNPTVACGVEKLHTRVMESLGCPEQTEDNSGRSLDEKAIATLALSDAHSNQPTPGQHNTIATLALSDAHSNQPTPGQHNTIATLALSDAHSNQPTPGQHNTIVTLALSDAHSNQPTPGQHNTIATLALSDAHSNQPTPGQHNTIATLALSDSHSNQPTPGQHNAIATLALSDAHSNQPTPGQHNTIATLALSDSHSNQPTPGQHNTIATLALSDAHSNQPTPDKHYGVVKHTPPDANPRQSEGRDSYQPHSERCTVLKTHGVLDLDRRPTRSILKIKGKFSGGDSGCCVMSDDAALRLEEEEDDCPLCRSTLSDCPQSLLTSQTVRGLSEQSILTSQTVQGMSGQSILTSQTVQGMSEQSLLTSQTVQGMSEQSILTSQTVQGMSGQSLVTSHTEKGLSGQSLVTSQTVQWMPGQPLVTSQTEKRMSGQFLVTSQTEKGMSGQLTDPGTAAVPPLSSNIPRSSACSPHLLSAEHGSVPTGPRSNGQCHNPPVPAHSDDCPRKLHTQSTLAQATGSHRNATTGYATSTYHVTGSVSDVIIPNAMCLCHVSYDVSKVVRRHKGILKNSASTTSNSSSTTKMSSLEEAGKRFSVGSVSSCSSADILDLSYDSGDCEPIGDPYHVTAVAGVCGGVHNEDRDSLTLQGDNSTPGLE